MKLQGKTAVVTGASTGIGREIAKAMAANGARVGLVARSAEGLKETQSLINNIEGEAIIFPTDLRDENAINKLASDVLAVWGSIDILVHNAGIWHNYDVVYTGISLADMSSEWINESIDVGIRAPFLLTRLFLPGMIKKNQGKILAITGGFPTGGAMRLPYYVSKLALEHLMLGLSDELREYEIQVNCISPSYVATEAIQKFRPEAAQTALSPVEVAKLAIFLLSEDADHITGQSIRVKNKSVH